MRELASFSNQEHATRFGAYLVTQSILIDVEQEDDEWIVWIVNDDDREASEKLLVEFRGDPNAEKYSVAVDESRRAAKEARKEKKQTSRREIDLRKRWGGSWWHCYPATYILIGVCVLVVIVCTNWKGMQQGPMGLPVFCDNTESPIRNALMAVNPQTLRPVDRHDFPDYLIDDLKHGEVWRLMTPAIIHWNLIHLFMNMMALKTLGAGVEFVRGTRRFLVLCLILAVVSSLVEHWWSGPNFGGMSGVLFGLVGYVWMKGRTQPRLGLGLSQQGIVYAFLWLFLCMAGVFGPIANGAHVGGFVAGILIGARQKIVGRIRESLGILPHE